jgi:hypothetical protein
MPRGFEGPEDVNPHEGGETIELSAENARVAINDKMREVFGTDGNEEIDPRNPVRVVE